MKTFTFWNNKGGTGKTSLCFQTSLQYAIEHTNERILVIDLCPQANLSEYFLGGMLGNGANHLKSLCPSQFLRTTIAGYFLDHIQSSYAMFPNFNKNKYICKPYSYNTNIPDNIYLVAGDNYVEDLSKSMSSLAANTLPTQDAYVKILRWIIDFIDAVKDEFDVVFIDTNPSFSIYTQMALAASENLIIPASADDSSTQAMHNLLYMIYGIGNPIAGMNSDFYSEMQKFNMNLPKIHLVVRNHLTQYMGTAKAYDAVLKSLETLAYSTKSHYPQHFTANPNLVIDIRDFNTVGQVAFAEATAFCKIKAGLHVIGTNNIQVNSQNIEDCKGAIRSIVTLL